MSRARPRSTSLIAAVLAAVLLPLGIPPAQAAPVPVPTTLGCDPIDPTACLLPFPNDYFTVPDATTETGLRVNFNPLAMPRNGTDLTEGGEGKPVDPTEWNRNDGFSPGSMVLTYVPGLDLPTTWGIQDRPHSDVGLNEPGYFDHRDHIADIGLYQRPDAPIVIINADTGERHPFWSELDSHPGAMSAAERVLILRPAVNFEEGERYIVALRNLKAADGSIIAPRPEFSAYKTGGGADAARQGRYTEDIFPKLEAAGIGRGDLYLAWDFTVASERNLAERVLHIRDDAFGRVLGDTDLSDRMVAGASPDFTVDSTSTFTDTWTDSRGNARSQSMRRVRGRVVVPNYLDRIQQTEGHVQENGTLDSPSEDHEIPVVEGIYYDAPAPGSRFLDTDLDGLPDQNPVESTVNVPFVCDVPLNGRENIAGLYGHGLLGDRDQINDFNKSPRRDGDFFGCAADWWGMSTVDLPTVAASLGDMSNFPSLPDRAQQGFLNFMFLGRAAVHPDGFATDPAFQQDGASLLNTDDGDGTEMVYDGNSQGGIMGGSLVAVSPDIHRAILGVTGMNYSTLLNRSVDWEGEYAEVFHQTYQDPVERQLTFTLIQMLWDRGEANGYAHHMTTDPYPNTPAHEVMLQVAFSDHQVTNHSAEVEARTIGAPLMTPNVAPGRHWALDPFIETASYPHQGSSLVYWDSGNATPPNGNLPASHGGDPHSHPRSEPASSWQEAHFLLTGQMYDVCAGGFYLTDNNPANNGQPSCHAPEWAAGSTPPEARISEVGFTSATPTSGQYSDATVFEGALTGGFPAGPVEGAEVVFELADVDSTRTFTATTNSEGIARVSPVLTETPGDYNLTVSFEGNDDLDGSSVALPFVVERDDSNTTLDFATKGKKQKVDSSRLIAQLSDLDSGAALSGRAIRFFADGSQIGSGTTDATGRAVLEVPRAYRKGHHSFEVRFPGGEFYGPSSGSQQT